ncbi:hypothetical protein ACFLYY_00880 [Patescibacteria group bacterium]
MIATPHLLVGAILATKISNPFLGLTLAFLSHFILDLIPHSEYWMLAKNVSGKWNHSKKKIFVVVIDVMIGVLLLWFLSQNKILALVGGFLGVLADFDNVYFLFPNFTKNKFFKLDQYSHKLFTHWFKGEKTPLFLGVTTQVIVILVAIYFLLLP